MESFISPICISREASPSGWIPFNSIYVCMYCVRACAYVCVMQWLINSDHSSHQLQKRGTSGSGISGYNFISLGSAGTCINAPAPEAITVHS